MKSEEAIKVLKRMKSSDLEADEFNAIKEAIKSLEENEKYKRRERIISKMLSELVKNDMTRDEHDALIEKSSISEIKERSWKFFRVFADVFFLISD